METRLLVPAFCCTRFCRVPRFFLHIQTPQEFFLLFSFSFQSVNISPKCHLLSRQTYVRKTEKKGQKVIRSRGDSDIGRIDMGAGQDESFCQLIAALSADENEIRSQAEVSYCLFISFQLSQTTESGHCHCDVNVTIDNGFGSLCVDLSVSTFN